jgi:fatty acid desaturase
MKERGADERNLVPSEQAVLLPLARLLLSAIIVACWLGIFLAVFVGLSTIPVLMMAGFLLAYVTFQYIRHRGRG